MEAFIFLFGIAIAWILFATVQDLKTREVANWLTFSLIAVALAFRAFLSIENGEWSYLFWGVIGGAFFVGCAYAFYYGKVFAGGDAKLLMGVGIALPYQSGDELLLWGSAFLFILFFGGAVYTLAYSVGLVSKRGKNFRSVFLEELREERWLFVFVLVLCGIMSFTVRGLMLVLGSFFLLLLPCLYAYLQSVERACMWKMTKPRDLREGDWLVRDVSVGKTKIKASVHGLSLEEIALLKKYRKSVMVKEGVPFVPAFLFAYGFMGYVFATGGLDWSRISSTLSSLVPVY